MGEYDIFQKFPDGTASWQLCISGRYNTQRKLQELAEISPDEFFAVDIASGERLSANAKQPGAPPAQRVKALRRNVA